MIYVYTSIVNGWDNLRPPLVVSNSENVRYLCFTNLPNLPCVGPWQYRSLPDLGSGCRSARLPKILPHLMLPADAECSIYHDGNFQLRVLPEQIIADLLTSADWAAHRHPARDCIYSEAEILLQERIGTAELINRQIARYRDDGYPEHAGLWANGLLVRRHTSRTVRLACEEWWKEFAAGCERDQVSFPPARRRIGLEVHAIEAHISESPLMQFSWHAAFKKPCDDLFSPARQRAREQLADLRMLTGLRNMEMPV